MTQGEKLIAFAIADAMFWGWKEGFGDKQSQQKALDNHTNSLKALKDYVLQLERKK